MRLDPRILLLLVVVGAHDARAVTCGRDSPVRSLKRGSVIEMSRAITLENASAFKVETGAQNFYRFFLIDGKVSTKPSPTSTSTEFEIPVSRLKLGPEGRLVIPAFRCILSGTPENTRARYARLTGAHGIANTASPSSTSFEFEPTAECPMTTWTTNRSLIARNIAQGSTQLSDLFADLGLVDASEENPLFAFQGDCWTKAEIAANEKAAAKAEAEAERVKKMTIAREPRFRSEPPVDGYPCAGDESVRELNPGSVLILKNPIPIEETDRVTIGSEKNHYGVSFGNQNRYRYGDARGRSIDIRVKRESTIAHEGKREIPPFRCILDAKPISEKDYFGPGLHQFGEASATYFNFKRTPECPLEHLAARRSPVDIRPWATDVSSLKFNLGPGFELQATCGEAKSSPSGAAPLERGSRIDTRTLKNLPKENSGTPPLSPARLPKTSQGAQ
jgi:hypothetical protein